MNLDQLQKIAEAATPCDYAEEYEYLLTFNPPTVLRLIAIARAAKELARLMDLPLRLPEGSHPVARVRHAEYGDEKKAAWTALRAALAELEGKQHV